MVAANQYDGCDHSCWAINHRSTDRKMLTGATNIWVHIIRKNLNFTFKLGPKVVYHTRDFTVTVCIMLLHCLACMTVSHLKL